MNKVYQFGHTTIEIQKPDEMMIPVNMVKFEVDKEEISVSKKYILEFSDDLRRVEQIFREKHLQIQEIHRSNMRILISGEQELRCIYIEGTAVPYAVLLEEGENLTRSWVDRTISNMLSIDTIFVAVLGIEKVMIRDNSLILHSAYMCRDGQAVLFSAPSGTGKSTQADLWTKYRGTRTINGDKSLLIHEENGWNAYGWPICGTSEICNNETYPIRAIVMLRQAKENAIRRLGMAEAMKKLIAQITMNMWNTKFQMKAMDLIQELIVEVPVYELECDISEEAVKCLEEVLMNE